MPAFSDTVGALQPATPIHQIDLFGTRLAPLIQKALSNGHVNHVLIQRWDVLPFNRVRLVIHK
jgi:hypothetical protein